MVSVPQVSKGIATFIQRELIVKATGIDRTLLKMSIPLIPQIIDKQFDKYKNNVLLECFITDNGIDIDELYKAAKQAMSDGEQILYNGIILNDRDLDNLYTYIKQAIV